MKYVVFALVVLSIFAVCIFYFISRKTAELHVTNVKTYVYTGETHEVKGTGNVIGQAATVEHDLYVVATIDIDNESPQPLAVNGIEAAYTSTDGSQRNAHAISVSDLVRLEDILPDLKPMLPLPLDFSGELAPKSRKQGQVLLEFPGFTGDIWKERKAATMTINFSHEAPQTVVIP